MGGEPVASGEEQDQKCQHQQQRREGVEGADAEFRLRTR